jgi:beta-lactamase superfamily II metal-dependent hydrolase
MGIKFEFLKAYNGDSILITTDEGVNILIDGGMPKTYSDKTSKTSTLKSKLRGVEHLDLVVLTHIDEDHICGLIELLKDDEHRGKIRELWFNSADYLEKINIQSKEKSYGQSNYFKALIDKYLTHTFIYRDDIFMEKQIDYPYGKISLKLLSPYIENLQDLDEEHKEWESKREKEGKTKMVGCNRRGITEVSRVDYDDKKALDRVANASSIAFILTYNNTESYLLLGDADVNMINRSLSKLNSNVLNFKFVKLSHHGSFTNNINQDFLDMIETDTYIVLTNGDKYNHPDEETIELILEHHKKKDVAVNILFNYEEYFLDKFKKFPKDKYQYKAYCKRIIS